MTAPQVAEAVFDSHRFVKRLTEAGMERGLAEVLAEEHMGPWIRNVATRTDLAKFRADMASKKDLENLRADMASKKDLENLRADMASKKDIENLRADMASKKDIEDLRADMVSKKDLEHTVELVQSDVEKRIAHLRGDLIKWMFGALMAQAALVVAIIKLFS